ncbi:PREDICTED: uncharacterized protein LOC106146997 [Chinchilla lanigera]|uniref:uncharacterized protein LOC106146997 n=1 Tax=Chinchilla lanigera TaxID=34839 RepID=UPI000697FC56|nr:PREDICTED: uncharacterized protein LOC106146997 [Chinchilla lanigera]
MSAFPHHFREADGHQVNDRWPVKSHVTSPFRLGGSSVSLRRLALLCGRTVPRKANSAKPPLLPLQTSALPQRGAAQECLLRLEQRSLATLLKAPEGSLFRGRGSAQGDDRTDHGHYLPLSGEERELGHSLKIPQYLHTSSYPGRTDARGRGVFSVGSLLWHHTTSQDLDISPQGSLFSQKALGVYLRNRQLAARVSNKACASVEKQSQPHKIKDKRQKWRSLLNSVGAAKLFLTLLGQPGKWHVSWERQACPSLLLSRGSLFGKLTCITGRTAPPR